MDGEDGAVRSKSVSKIKYAEYPPSFDSISNETSRTFPLLAITVTVDPETVASNIDE